MRYGLLDGQLLAYSGGWSWQCRTIPHRSFRTTPGRRCCVSTDWLAEHLDDPGLVVAESDEDVLLYETGHIPGAVKLDWHTELNDPVTRDYVDGPASPG